MAVSEAPSPPVNASALAAVFGPAEHGVTDIQAWARKSKQLFVRSQTQVARWSEGASGKTLSAFETLDAFKWPVLEQLVDKPSAIIVKRGCEASTVLRAMREATGFGLRQVASKARVSESDIELAESGRRRVPIRVLQRIAQAIALDSDRVGAATNGGGDSDLLVRFRDLQQTQGAMSQTVVLGLAEAAWVIATQAKLEDWLDPARKRRLQEFGFAPTPLSSSRRPAWRDGIDLAHRTRELLSIGQGEPIRKLTALLENSLAIPVIFVDLPERFAGATIANGQTRGIIANINGINRNVWVRRMTLAHELGHLLWDCDEDLNRLRVDEGDGLDKDPHRETDRIEMRANAFAAEFLSPQAAAVDTYRRAGAGEQGISAVMQKFGVSFTAAKWQLRNGLRFSNETPPDRALRNTAPGDDWRADEIGTVDYFPVRETGIARRGRFAKLCLDAHGENLISDDTAADYLGTDAAVFRLARADLSSLLGA